MAILCPPILSRMFQNISENVILPERNHHHAVPWHRSSRVMSYDNSSNVGRCVEQTTASVTAAAVSSTTTAPLSSTPVMQVSPSISSSSICSIPSTISPPITASATPTSIESPIGSRFTTRPHLVRQSPISTATTSRARKQLFGRGDPAETKRDLEREQQRITEEYSRIYSFDFEKGTPITDQPSPTYEWIQFGSNLTAVASTSSAPQLPTSSSRSLSPPPSTKQSKSLSLSSSVVSGATSSIQSGNSELAQASAPATSSIAPTPSTSTSRQQSLLAHMPIRSKARLIQATGSKRPADEPSTPSTTKRSRFSSMSKTESETVSTSPSSPSLSSSSSSSSETESTVQ